jgi:hypothetical protein
MLQLACRLHRSAADAPHAAEEQPDLPAARRDKSHDLGWD